MKYCSKCGAELLDEAVICPKCGCPVEQAKKPDKDQAKLHTAGVLNIIAFVLNILIVLFVVVGSTGGMKEIVQDAQNEMGDTADVTVETDIFTGDITDIKGKDEVNGEIQSDVAYSRGLYGHFVVGAVVWGLIAAASFVLGLRLVKKPVKKLSTVYTLMAIPGPVIFLVLNNMMLAALVCGFGLLLFVPAILQVIAGVKFGQCAFA